MISISKFADAARIFLSILCASLALAAESRGASPAAAKAQFEALPLLRSRQNHLLVRAFINDRPALLIVDTGSPGTVLASRRRSYFGVTNVAADSNFPARVRVNGTYNKLVMVRSLRLGGLNIADVPTVAADLSAARRTARSEHEPEADGILGADVLFAARAVLDCQQKLLMLNTRPDLLGTMPGLDLRGFQKMPMVVSPGYNLYVDGSVNDAPARLLVDTGAFATLLHRPFVRQLNIATEQTHLKSAALNLKNQGIDVARIRKLSLGLVNITGRDVGVLDLGGVLHEGLQRTPPAVGLLGAEILSRHHAIIDFGTRTLYLRQKADAPPPRSQRPSGPRPRR